MALSKSSRGRPKGSGIDDQSRLRDIAALIDQDPNLKPTTAIRAIGVTDPSAIRRLRDKFNQFRADVIDTEPEQVEAATTKTHVEPQREVQAPRVVAASVPADDRKTAPVMTEAQGAVAKVVAGNREPAGWLTSWFGVSVALATSAAEFQFAVIDQMLRIPQLGWDAPFAGATGPSRPTLLH